MYVGLLIWIKVRHDTIEIFDNYSVYNYLRSLVRTAISLK